MNFFRNHFIFLLILPLLISNSLIAMREDESDFIPLISRNIEVSSSSENEEFDEKSLLLAAQKGDTDAMYHLGTIYDEKKNFKKAKEFFLQASRKGHKDAQAELGIISGQKELEEKRKKLKYIEAFEDARKYRLQLSGSAFYSEAMNPERIRGMVLMNFKIDFREKLKEQKNNTNVFLSPPVNPENSQQNTKEMLFQKIVTEMLKEEIQIEELFQKNLPSKEQLVEMIKNKKNLLLRLASDMGISQALDEIKQCEKREKKEENLSSLMTYPNIFSDNSFKSSSLLIEEETLPLIKEVEEHVTITPEGSWPPYNKNPFLDSKPNFLSPSVRSNPECFREGNRSNRIRENQLRHNISDEYFMVSSSRSYECNRCFSGCMDWSKRCFIGCMECLCTCCCAEVFCVALVITWVIVMYHYFGV